MPTSAQPDLLQVDWSVIPRPLDDGAASHLMGMTIPADVELVATGEAAKVVLGTLPGRVVLFAYPRTGRPGEDALVDDWDQIPGARGCTPQSCSFRDLYSDLRRAGASRVFGLSSQDTAYQTEAWERLHLPFPLLSDERLELTRALSLPTMVVAGLTLIKRMALVIDNGTISKVFYPVFPPDRSAGEVLDWLWAGAQV